MRIQENNGCIKLWLYNTDTYNWANRPGKSWPCSQLSDRRLFAEFEANGDLVDYGIDGNYSEETDVNEFNAITSDHIRHKFPEHPAAEYRS